MWGAFGESGEEIADGRVWWAGEVLGCEDGAGEGGELCVEGGVEAGGREGLDEV